MSTPKYVCPHCKNSFTARWSFDRHLSNCKVANKSIRSSTVQIVNSITHDCITHDDQYIVSNEATKQNSSKQLKRYKNISRKQNLYLNTILNIDMGECTCSFRRLVTQPVLYLIHLSMF